MSEQEEYQELPASENVPMDTEPAGRGLLGSLMVRVTLGLVILVVVIVGVGAIVFSSMRSSRNKPLNIKTYPGATFVKEEKLSDGFGHHDRRQYSTTATLEEIEQFYDRQKDMECKRYNGTLISGSGQQSEAEGHVFTSCKADHSGWGVTQYATVLIQPVYDDSLNPTGEVLVQIERYWGS